MSRQIISTGTVPNDGNGDTLSQGASKINSNFNEIYTTFGDGVSLTGFQGATGARGPQGVVGPQGIIGNLGPQGFIGPQGILGVQGSIGNLGPQGAVGGISYSVTNNGSSAFVFNPSVLGISTNPTLTLARGLTYYFTVNAVGHPFWIKTSPVTGITSSYDTGVENNGVQTGVLSFTVPNNAPSTLYYICQNHLAMQGVITVTEVGFIGPQGAQGVIGPQGVQGPFGFQGAQGFIGPQGNIGPQGSQGLRGPQGSLGPQGSQGVQGSTGFRGPQGSQGIEGFQGAIGPQGNQGNQGILGPQGSQGVQGSTGFRGPQGSQGIEGFQGAIGPQGNQGNQGILGPQGSQSFNYWTQTATGIHTLSNVGIGTTNATNTLTVVGSGTSTSQLYVTGVSTFRNNVFVDNYLVVNQTSTNPRISVDVSGNTAIAMYYDTSSTQSYLISANKNINIKVYSPQSVNIMSGDLNLASFNSNSAAQLYKGVTVTGTTQTDNISVGTGGTVITTTSGGLVGINSITPAYTLDVSGNARVGINTSQGVILTSPNGTKYQLFVENGGTLKTVAV